MSWDSFFVSMAALMFLFQIGNTGKYRSLKRSYERVLAFMKFNKILVAYDGSPLSDKAIDQIAHLIQTDPSVKLEVLHVAHSPNLVVGEAFIPPSAEIRRSVYEDADNVLKRAAERLEAFSVTAHIQMREGQPAPVIIEVARETNCDLIVVGSRGLSGFRELFLGSVSHGVVQHSPLPVLVIK